MHRNELERGTGSNVKHVNQTGVKSELCALAYKHTPPYIAIGLKEKTPFVAATLSPEDQLYVKIIVIVIVDLILSPVILNSNEFPLTKEIVPQSLFPFSWFLRYLFDPITRSILPR